MKGLKMATSTPMSEGNIGSFRVMKRINSGVVILVFI